MKREPFDDRFSTIRPIWPVFFWLKCIKCCHEFRREYGWAFNRNSVSERVGCQECFPLKQHFVDYLNRPMQMPKGGSGTAPRTKPSPPPFTTITKEGTEYKR